MEKNSKIVMLADKILPESKERLVVFLSLAILCIISAVYFYWFSNGIFFYQENRSLFIFSGDYRQNFIVKPGGLLVFAGNFLTQGYFNALYGPFLVTVSLILVAIVSKKIIRRLSSDRSNNLFLILLPTGFLLLLQTRYDLFIYHILFYSLIYLLFNE